MGVGTIGSSIGIRLPSQQINRRHPNVDPFIKPREKKRLRRRNVKPGQMFNFSARVPCPDEIAGEDGGQLSLS